MSMTSRLPVERAASALLLIVLALAATVDAQTRRTGLSGVWILAGTPTIEMTLTPAGEAARARYDPLKDDPAMQCIPATITRVMHTPSPPIEIRQHRGDVEINYEFMDVHRRVPLEGALANAPYTVADHPHMGRSIGRYEGEELVIDTVDVEAGYLDTLGFAGLPQSAEMRTEERFIPAGDRLRVVLSTIGDEDIVPCRPEAISL